MGFSFFRSKIEWHRISCDYLLCRCYTQLWCSTRCKPEMKSRSSLVCGVGIFEEQLTFWLSGHAKWGEERKSSSLLPAGIRQPRCDAPGSPWSLLCCCLYLCHLPGVRAVWVWFFCCFCSQPLWLSTQAGWSVLWDGTSTIPPCKFIIWGKILWRGIMFGCCCCTYYNYTRHSCHSFVLGSICYVITVHNLIRLIAFWI